MQVRKFEAKSMQDALAMVKRELGPEAIILAAKDNKGSFGLAGETSVEVTAAVSGHKLKEHQFAISRLRDQDRDQVLNSPAKHQKSFVEKSVKRYVEDEEYRRITMRRYIDIDEEEAREELPKRNGSANTASAQSYVQQGNMARVKQAIKQNKLDFVEEEKNTEVQEKSARVTAATKKALQAFSDDFEEEAVVPKQEVSRPAVKESNSEVADLRKQIEALEKVIANFRDIPRNFLPSHPGAQHDIPYELSPSFENLLKKGIEETYAADLVMHAQNQLEKAKWSKRSVVDAVIARELIDRIKVSKKLENGVHIFVGNSGSGKTSSLIKMAARQLIHHHKKVAILTTDILKVGASEQLKVYAKILNVPFGIVRSKEDWTIVLEALRDMDMIFVDTPGVALRNLEEIEYIKASIPDSIPTHSHVHLVQSVTMKNADAKKYAEKFKVFGFEDIVFTKLDESVQHGLIYNQSLDFNVPILGFGVGTNMPEDYEEASAERVIDLLFRLSSKKERE